jgi:hypothetical protein
MKVIFASVLIALGIGVVAALVLSVAQRPAYEVYSTSSTSVREPGHNLVGENWSGNPEPPRNG